MYQDFRSWFYEIENFGLRAERFWDSLEHFQSAEGKLANLELWLEAAFNAAREADPGCQNQPT